MTAHHHSRPSDGPDQYPQVARAQDRCGWGTDFGCKGHIANPIELAHAIHGFDTAGGDAVLFHEGRCCPCGGCLALVETEAKHR
jgi:hypothetical protein